MAHGSTFGHKSIFPFGKINDDEILLFGATLI